MKMCVCGCVGACLCGCSSRLEFYSSIWTIESALWVCMCEWELFCFLLSKTGVGLLYFFLLYFFIAWTGYCVPFQKTVHFFFCLIPMFVSPETDKINRVKIVSLLKKKFALEKRISCVFSLFIGQVILINVLLSVWNFLFSIFFLSESPCFDQHQIYVMFFLLFFFFKSIAQKMNIEKTRQIT